MLNSTQFLKDNPRQFASVCLAFISLLSGIALVVFDIVQIVNVNKNSAMLSASFLTVNIVLLSVTVFLFAVCFALIFTRPKQIKSNKN